MTMTNLIPQKPRIAIVVTAKSTAESFVFPLARHLADRGSEVVVIADGLASSIVGAAPGIEFVSVRMPRRPAPILDLFAVRKLYTVFRNFEPAAVIYATPKASLVASLSSRLAGVRSRVYLLWGLRLETTRRPARYVYWSLEKVTHRNSTLTIANSKSLAAKYVAERLGKAGEVIVVGDGSSHGVDLQKFSRASEFPEVDRATRAWLDANRERVVAGYVGRLNPDKGIDTLCAALNLIPAVSPVSLMVVGGGDGDTTVLESPTVPIHDVGHVDDPRPYFAEMAFLVLPSRREGFPNVVLEAAAMGIPAIVSDATGCVDSVVDGETGLIFRAGDEVQLARAISAIAVDTEFRQALGAAAQVRAERHFSQNEVLTANVDRLYQEMARL